MWKTYLMVLGILTLIMMPLAIVIGFVYRWSWNYFSSQAPEQTAQVQNSVNNLTNAVGSSLFFIYSFFVQNWFYIMALAGIFIIAFLLFRISENIRYK